METGAPVRLLPVATVKSDPWKKGKCRARPKLTLWSEAFWKQINGAKGGEKSPFSGECLRLICAMNESMYGRA